jgi:hypothetical protein
VTAVVGDVLTIDVVVNIDPDGFSFAGVSLEYDSTDLVGTSAVECPMPPNLAPGLCSSITFLFYTPFASGVAISNLGAGSLMSSFDAGKVPPFEFTPSTLTLGRATFVYNSSGGTDVSTFYVSGLDSVNDGLGNIAFPAALATVNGDGGPEPPTCEEELVACESDLADAEDARDECLDDPPFEDADGDGEHDDTDACPATPAGETVDAAGCSLVEFCAGLPVPAACNNGDWRNDEPLGNAQDCKARRGVCAPR